ncbi:MAG: sodium:proton antiporter [Tindallia sp. MSAO_Bac2]|nr:MAG: sodium:proton antiporter [Tindallia sp. MSAO_Bac2]
MAISLALITILGMLFHSLFRKIGLPGLLGLLLLGALGGPYGLDFIDGQVVEISADLRQIALIVILLRAGLGIKRDTLNQVGVNALKLSFLPCIMEGMTITAAAFYLFNFSFLEAGMLGFIIAAVSPAVIVPSMLSFIEEGKGEEKGIPTMMLAGASLDDVVAITFLTSFIGIYSGRQVALWQQVLSIPMAIFTGLLLGLLVAVALLKLFNSIDIRHTKKTLILIGTGVLMTGVEDLMQGVVPMASLIGVMFVGFIILERMPRVAEALSSKLNKVWVLAEIVLFTMVGAVVNVPLALEAGLVGIALIVIGLSARSLGVFLSLAGKQHTMREKMFCIISYIPKATVQAAVGALPLAAGAVKGEEILAFAVLSIVITAPLGAWLIQWGGKNLLEVKE